MRSYLMPIITFILLSNAIAELPSIKEDEIIFIGGKKLQYESSENLKGSDTIQGKDLLSTITKPTMIKEWNRVIIVKTIKLFEGERKEITIYQYDGKNLNKSYPFEGEVFFLINTKRILLAQKSAHNLIDHSIILDINGNIKSIVKQHNNVFDIVKSDDDKIIWIKSNHIKNGKPYTLVKIIDYNGILINNIEVYEKKIISLDYQGEIYIIKVGTPKIPG